MKKTSLFFLLITLLFISSNYAQSFYQDYGEGGAEVSTFVIFDENSNIFLGPKIGVSLNGQLDLGLKFGVNILEKNELVESQSSYEFTPYLNLHFFKQGDGDMPLSALTGIGYRYGKTKTDFSTNGSSEAITNYVVVTYGLYRDFTIDNNLIIQPRFIIEMNLGETEITTRVANNQPENISVKAPNYFEISFPLIYRPSGKNKYFIAPLILFSEGTTSYGLYLGLTL